jgi:plastocyanin
MKKFLLTLLATPILIASANTHIISVSSNQFTPANLNVVVGDVIRWQWSSGFHNTASVTIPAGALDWISPYLTGSGDFYEYTVTETGLYEYYCEVHGTGMSGSFTASGTMPVTLTSFNVTNRQEKPFLTWITAAEENTRYFAVRRSYDGLIFNEIGRVPAAGSSTQTRNYSYLDNQVGNNRRFVYYELAITDIDGKVQLSPIKLFKNDKGTNKLITSISPNPVSKAGHLLLQYNAEAKSSMMVRLLDMTGKQLLTTVLSANEGVNNGHVHIADLPSGSYVVQFTLEGRTESHKIRKE